MVTIILLFLPLYHYSGHYSSNGGFVACSGHHGIYYHAWYYSIALMGSFDDMSSNFMHLVISIALPAAPAVGSGTDSCCAVCLPAALAPAVLLHQGAGTVLRPPAWPLWNHPTSTEATLALLGPSAALTATAAGCAEHLAAGHTHLHGHLHEKTSC